MIFDRYSVKKHPQKPYGLCGCYISLPSDSMSRLNSSLLHIHDSAAIGIEVSITLL
jgi:hypothetical protein